MFTEIKSRVSHHWKWKTHGHMMKDDSSERKRIELWVDAICIDQLDARERIRQVFLMRGIFGTATRVLA